MHDRAPTDGMPARLVGGRFTVTALLGRGSFGSVYAVDDRQSSARFALKRLDRDHAGAIAGFKAEFRALTELRHPNLVRLYELFHDGGRWMFTMELLVGVDPLGALGLGVDSAGATETGTADTAADAPPRVRWWTDERLAPTAGADPDRIRTIFSGIAAGVVALHRAGLLHRDLKPSNILVDQRGDAKLLDFGLITMLTEHRVAGVVGTRAYLAPELFEGHPPSPASDWFAVGVVLHQALTGRLPSTLPSEPQNAPLSALRGPLPRLCEALLRPVAGERPRAPEILKILGERSAGGPSGARPGGPVPFVGREAERSALARCFARSRRGSVVALVLGISGAGKSTLARRFVEDLERRGVALVASGRCFQQEVLPLKALDSLVASLGRALAGRFAADSLELPPDDRAALLRLFPALAPWLGTSATTSGPLDVEPRALRRRAIGAFERLLAALSRRCALVLYIDDVQWGDAASGELLARLCAAGHDLLLVVTCRREEAEGSEFLRALRPTAEVQRVEVPPLEPEDSRRLIRALISPGEVSDEWVDALARESEGSPFFAEQLARVRGGAPRPPSLDVVVSDRVGGLGDVERRVVELLAVADRPVDRRVLFEVPTLGAEAWRAVDRLLGLRLVRLRGSEHPQVESYHDRIRHAVLVDLPAPRRRGHHLDLAVAMEGRAVSDPGRIAEHFARAERGERAIPHAITAADAAVDGLAFERAVELYTLAIEQLGVHRPRDPRGRALRVRRADTLVQAGRCAEAASRYETLAAEADDPTALRHRAAAQWMTSGHYERGIALLRRLLPGAGLRWPTSELDAVMRSAGLVVQLRASPLRSFTRAAAHPLDARLSHQLDLCWSASRGLVSVDLARGTYYYLRGALLSLRSGDPLRVAQSLGGAASLLRSVGLGLGDRLWAHARAAARQVDTPYVWGLFDYFEGFAQISRGHYQAASTALRAALEQLEGHGRGVALEVTVGRSMLCDCLYMLGRLGELGTLARDSHERARALGDIQGTIGSLLFVGLDRLARGDVAAARRHLLEVDRLETLEAYSFQRAVSRDFLVRCDLYEGQRAAAWRRSEREWAAFRRSSLTWSAIIRARALSVRGAAFVAALSVEDGSVPEPRGLRRGARRCARGLRRTGQAWANAEAALLMAAVHAYDGGLGLARRRLREAEAIYAREGMPLRACSCGARRAQLDGDALALADHTARLRASGIEDPAAWLNAYAPWP